MVGKYDEVRPPAQETHSHVVVDLNNHPTFPHVPNSANTSSWLGVETHHLIDIRHARRNDPLFRDPDRNRLAALLSQRPHRGGAFWQLLFPDGWRTVDWDTFNIVDAMTEIFWAEHQAIAC